MKTAPDDDVVRRVLELAATRHVDRHLLDPAHVLEGARAGARRLGVGAAGDAAHARDRLVPDLPGLAPVLGALVEEARDALDARMGEPTASAASLALARASILDGALRAMDRWSSASTGRRRERLRARHEGRRVGIGARLGRRDGVVRVLGVLPDSGAERAGLRTGDEILSIDHVPLGASTVAAVISRLRARAGTRVHLHVGRAGRTVAADVERIALRTGATAGIGHDGSTGRLERPAGTVGVLRLSRVSKLAGRTVAHAMARARSGGPPRAWLLDLRGNAGGSLIGAAAVADLFVGSGVLVEALDRDDRPVSGLRSRIEATPGGDETTPLAVLVDERTASAAELVAACLTRHDRAVLVGARTFGKTTVAQPIHFHEADLTVRLSVATMRAAGRPLPPDGLTTDVPLPVSGSAAAGSPTEPDLPHHGDLRHHADLADLPHLADWLLEHGHSRRTQTLRDTP